MATFELDATKIEALSENLKNFQGNFEEIVNNVLHNDAGPMINDEIMNLLPSSGRTWAKKKKLLKMQNHLHKQMKT